MVSKHYLSEIESVHFYPGPNDLPQSSKKGLSIGPTDSANAGLVLLLPVSLPLVSEETLSKRVGELEMELKKEHIDIRKINENYWPIRTAVRVHG